MITKGEIEDYLGEMSSILKPLMASIEDQVMKQRDKNKIPPCISKWRIKSLNSLYLKTKIKKIKDVKDLTRITDISGMRFLVLFEDDLIVLHETLLDILLDKKKGLRLEEYKLFNWSDPIKEEKFLKVVEKKQKLFNESVGEIGPVYKYLPMNPDSGYRSIHYLFKHKDGGYHIEIQLRTYLQDVWGELEHSLVYKQGHINPFIRETFVRLAEELAVKDANIQFLNQLSKKERRFNKSVKKYEKICPYILHNKPLIAKKNYEGEKYIKYVNHAQQHRANEEENRKDEWIEEGQALLDDLYKTVESDDEDKKYLWYTTEKAYWLLIKGDYKEARKLYKTALGIRQRLKDSVQWGYSINLRMGETYMAEGDYNNAWEQFDEAEMHVPTDFKGDELSVYQLKDLLAYHYWVFGPEMYELALEKMLDAKNIYEQNKDKFVCDEESYVRNINNNMCWYQLEVCVKAYQRIKKYMGDHGEKNEKISKEEIEKYKKLKEDTRISLEVLEEMLDKTDCSNEYDTAAWTCYNLYLMESKVNDLKKAYLYAEQMLNKKKNKSKQIDISNALQKTHMQEIVNEMSERGMLK